MVKKKDWNKIQRENLGIPPQEVSKNINSPEVAPSNKRITTRTKPLTTKLSPEVYDSLLKIAYQRKCKLVEIIEEGIKLVEKGNKEK